MLLTIKNKKQQETTRNNKKQQLAKKKQINKKVKCLFFYFLIYWVCNLPNRRKNYMIRTKKRCKTKKIFFNAILD